MHSAAIARDLRNVVVEVRYKLGEPPHTRVTVRVKPMDNLRKVKNHIFRSLDVQGRLMYRQQNCDDFPTKRLSEYPPKKEDDNIFYLFAAGRKLRVKQHTIELHLPEEFAAIDRERKVQVKVSRTTTVSNLKHKLQNERGIPIDEQSIHVLGQQNECHPETNVMQLPVLEVKWQRKEASPPLKMAVKRTHSQKGSISGTPYSNKLTMKKSLEASSIHPKKMKEKPGI